MPRRGAPARSTFALLSEPLLPVPERDASWPSHVVEENGDLAPVAITTVLGWFYLKSFLYRSASVSDGEVHQGPAL